MNCKLYQNLTCVEKVEFVGKIIHLLQNYDQSFTQCAMIIEQGEITGKFDEVIINPPQQTEPENY